MASVADEPPGSGFSAAPFSPPRPMLAICATRGCQRAFPAGRHRHCCRACRLGGGGSHTRRCDAVRRQLLGPGELRRIRTCETAGCQLLAFGFHSTCCSTCGPTMGNFHTRRCRRTRVPSPGRDQRTASGPMSRGRDRDSGTRCHGGNTAANGGADAQVGMLGTYHPGFATSSSWHDARWEWESTLTEATAGQAFSTLGACSTTSSAAVHPGCTGDAMMAVTGSEGPSGGTSEQSSSTVTPSFVHSNVQGGVHSPGLMNAGDVAYPSASLLIEVFSSSSEGAREDDTSRCNADGNCSLNELD